MAEGVASADLHSLWDGLLIAQALRTIPRNYTRALPTGKSSLDIESHLRGTIYDPYVRRLMYEGFGNDQILGRFTTEYSDWLTCPEAAQPVSSWGAVQQILGLQRTRDEDRWDDEVLCPYGWSKELHTLNCELVWPRELDEPPYNHAAFSASSTQDEEVHDEEAFLDSYNGGRPRPHPELLELDTPQYSGRIRRQWVVERLLAMAGIRLAGILNGLFLDVESLNSTTESFPVVHDL